MLAGFAPRVREQRPFRLMATREFLMPYAEAPNKFKSERETIGTLLP
jgi:hypothetical protein